MAAETIAFLQTLFTASMAAHEKFASSSLQAIATAAEAVGHSLRSGGKVLAFGNGGSASDAQHLVAELVGRFEGERRALAAIALTADSNVVTAISNDYGYDRLFVRQIDGLGRPGDIAFGISTSGRSPNVVAALTAAKSRGLITIALTGRDGGPMGADADIHLHVAEEATPRVQEVHRTILHAMCSLIDRELRLEDEKERR
jgi:D-sedoheptulose 7-phosphate isomerase